MRTEALRLVACLAAVLAPLVVVSHSGAGP
jgi:hypothetical protein